MCNSPDGFELETAAEACGAVLCRIHASLPQLLIKALI
jgi:hypothetical protein